MPPRRPHWFPGGPPGDDPLGGSHGKPGLFNPLSRVPNWMRGALGLLRDELPNRLRTDQVVPAVEFGQQGWGFVTYIPIRVELTTGAPAFRVPPGVEADPGVIRRIIYISAEHSAAGNRSLQVILRFPALGLVPAFIEATLTETSVAPAGITATTADIAQGVPLDQPPGGTLGFTTDLVAAETMTLETLWAEYPAGYPLSGF